MIAMLACAVVGGAMLVTGSMAVAAAFRSRDTGEAIAALALIVIACGAVAAVFA